jgi:hypothetical protein
MSAFSMDLCLATAQPYQTISAVALTIAHENTMWAKSRKAKVEIKQKKPQVATFGRRSPHGGGCF